VKIFREEGKKQGSLCSSQSPSFVSSYFRVLREVDSELSLSVVWMEGKKPMLWKT
jgi:hypothetical protein